MGSRFAQMAPQTGPGSDLRAKSEVGERKVALPLPRRGLPGSYYATGTNVIMSPRVRQFFRDAAKDAKTDWEKAQMLKKAIGRRIRYDLQAPAVPSDKDPVDFVLFESRVGYCDLYATCMVIGARVLGLPSRYATGYYPSNQRREGNVLTLSEAEAHAWGEVYFDGFGWMPLDPTEDAENNAERGDPTFVESFFAKTWVRTTGATLGLLILVVGGWFVIRYLRRPPIAMDPTRAEAAGAFREFYRTMEKGTGRPKRPSQTPAEYIEMVRPILGDKAPEAAEISNRLTYGLFARTPLESSEVQSIRRQIQELKTRLRR
jgi:transglutaminase-like putative cysteine protease